MSSLYFSLSACISGASTCIRFIERVLAAVNGQNTTLMSTVINTIVPAVTQPGHVVQPVHRQQQRLRKKPRKPPEIHHQVGLVLKLVPDARQQAIFLRSGKEDDLPFDCLMRRERCRRINERSLDALRRRRARHWLDVRERRQTHRARDDLRRRVPSASPSAQKIGCAPPPKPRCSSRPDIPNAARRGSSQSPSRKTIPPTGPERPCRQTTSPPHSRCSWCHPGPWAWRCQ